MTQGARSIIPEIDGDAVGLFELPNATGTPERRLLLAVLERAILDYVGNDPREIQEAEDWIFSMIKSDRDAFSFQWLCAELDLLPDQVQKVIKNMPKRGNKRVAPWYFAREQTQGTLSNQKNCPPPQLVHAAPKSNQVPQMKGNKIQQLAA